MARFCFEFAHDKEGPCQAKALLTLREVFVGLGNDDRARAAFEEVYKSHPGSDFVHQAHTAMHLIRINSGDQGLL